MSQWVNAAAVASLCGELAQASWLGTSCTTGVGAGGQTGAGAEVGQGIAVGKTGASVGAGWPEQAAKARAIDNKSAPTKTNLGFIALSNTFLLLLIVACRRQFFRF